MKIVTSTGFFNKDETGVAVELAEETLEKGEKSGYAFIFAEVNGVVAGYCCFGRIPCTKSSYDLYWIAVRQDHQNLGIGKKLIEKVENTVRKEEGTRIFIETSSTLRYEPTRRFYRRAGYIQEASLHDFYAPGDHKIIYSKCLI